MTKKKNDSETLTKWTTPVGAYITFNSEKGIQKALDHTYDTVDDFYDLKIEALKPAPEPTDIIWENRSIPSKQVKKNAFYLSLFILIVSIGVFIVTIKML